MKTIDFWAPRLAKIRTESEMREKLRLLIDEVRGIKRRQDGKPDKRTVRSGNDKWGKYRPHWHVAVGPRDFLQRVMDSDPGFNPADSYNLVVAMNMRDHKERKQHVA